VGISQLQGRLDKYPKKSGSPDWNSLLRELVDPGRKRKRDAAADSGEVPTRGDEVLVQLNADGTVNEGDGPGYIVVTTTSHPAVQ